MGRKKKFIDKKKAATFQLLSRDSSDPNYDEGPSGDRVFVRIDGNTNAGNSFFDEHNDAEVADADPNDIFADAPDDDSDEDGVQDRVPRMQFRSPVPSSGNSALPDHVRREILELGFPDDGYNYLLHLREIKNTGAGSAYYENPKARLEMLPRDVKAYDASRIEISKGNDDSYEKSIYSVASKTVGVKIQKVLDPEVAALLDDSDLSRFGSDAEDLEEDFVVNANLPEEQEDLELDKRLSLVEVNKEESNKSNISCPQDNIVDFIDEVRSNIPNARMGLVGEKPRVRRPLDEQFDLLELQEYGTESEDEYDGAISEENEYHESLAGKLNHALKDRVMDDLELDGKYKAPSDLLHDESREKDGSMESAAILIDRCKKYGEKYEKENEDDNVLVIEESSDESEVWDCETIITTYSNLDNHPGKIGAPESRRKKLVETVTGALTAPTHVISLKGKQKLPVDFLPHSRKPAAETVTDESKLSTEKQKRKQHGQESKEEKKERKAAVKDERREARRIKKELKVIYKSESQHAQKVAAFTGPSSIHLM